VLLRILAEDKDGIATLRLFGRLDADGVAELQKSYESCTGTIELDLSQLRSIDDVGAAYLGGLVDAGVKVVQVNPYVAALLRLGGSVDRRPGRPGRAR
jgi:anti-anti-sigma regulatory factor